MPLNSYIKKTPKRQNKIIVVPAFQTIKKHGIIYWLKLFCHLSVILTFLSITICNCFVNL